ncbi:MAG TPA: NAD(P)/FAD-dependent oxidoreductase [Hyphomonas sp.]|nr:NAD(P)/FAD-dependent oxidoreductase [Hyphomonas sp.]HPE48532.1 NAD(P)/FAD-dependent oxidoreductase [Hyphomonas sp.]
MTGTETKKRPAVAKAEHFDVLVAGAGISGVGAAYHLRDQAPDKTFVVLEKLESFGGTWLWHKYPGIRSDSDLYTFGYRFKPWTGVPIATAQEILDYMDEVIEENDLGQYIRYGHKILSAEWSSEDSLWTVTAQKLDTGEELYFTCNFLWMCQGYYNYENPYTPEWADMDKFKGEIIHPQLWPAEADMKGKRVICIGSGATTATVVPAIAGDAEHVTVLQRSPTWFIPGRNENELVVELEKIGIDWDTIHRVARQKVLFDQHDFTRRCLEETETVEQELLEGVKMFLGDQYPIEKHFTPRYRPWRQRIAFVPDGDLFQGIASGKADVVTDEIERFTENGILTKSGEELKADVIITATGFNLSVLGDIPFTVDGKPVDFSQTVTYRGMMFTGVPNMAWVFGYFRASWTLRVDIMADFIIRLLKHMDEKGVTQVRVQLREEDKDMEILPWIDPENFNPGYLMRNMHMLPKRGSNYEWQHTQDYWREKDEMPLIDLDGEQFAYAGKKAKTKEKVDA